MNDGSPVHRTRRHGQRASVDPARVWAISKMPAPTDKAGVQRLFGLMQFLSKFLPRLSDITKTIRELTQNGVKWTWGPAQEASLEALKKAVMSTPVLHYYNQQEEVTLQYDASEFGLGTALLQMESLWPVHPVPVQMQKHVTPKSKKNCSQVYGRDLIQVESDHKPLEAIFCKPLHSAPKQLQ